MRSVDWVLARPWAITEESLQTILAIAERRNESPEAVEAKLGRPMDNTHKVVVRDGVALVPVVGPIARYADLFTEISGATSIDTLARDFRTALDDRSVKAIVLNVDSPGGTVAGISEFADQVKAARGTKPIVAYVGSQAASAGYWIASAADQVVADSTAILGSIGVVMGMPRKKASDPVEIVSSQSPHKRPNIETEAGRSQLQAMADDLGDLFVNAVASNRGVTPAQVLADFGQGGQFVASKAVAAGMADGIGSLEGVIACLARGEMPCPRPTKPTRKGQSSNPKEPAMSEQANPPVAGDQPSMSLAEANDLRKRLADAEARLTAETTLKLTAINEAISARADAFVRDFAGAATATTFAVGLRKLYVQAAQDDHAHPVAGAPAFRADALREAMKSRPAPTKEAVNADPNEQTRALGEDPATEEKSASADDLDAFETKARQYAKSLNGSR